MSVRQRTQVWPWQPAQFGSACLSVRLLNSLRLPNLGRDDVAVLVQSSQRSRRIDVDARVEGDALLLVIVLHPMAGHVDLARAAVLGMGGRPYVPHAGDGR